MKSRQKPPHTVELTDAEYKAVEKVAQALGVSVEQAATQMAQEAIRDRFVRIQPQGAVIKFERKPKK